MKNADFSDDSPGKLVPIEFVERSGGLIDEPKTIRTQAFQPNPLPPQIDWDQLRLDHFDDYTETVAELGRLNGLHKRIGNAAGMLRTLWMREAKLSSEVEDVHTTAEDLVLAGAGRNLGVRESGLESWNYVEALEHGVRSDLPFSTRLIKEMHKRLLHNVRGDENQPGEFRNCQVYIGDRSRGAGHARFVPPPHEFVPDAMSDLEKFVNRRHEQIPPLFVVALTHYQFETIHPFRDGNGRIGRVLISRSLVAEGLLDHPVVYMSAYVNEHKKRYVDLLLEISQQGGNAWSDWIVFIMEAIRSQARDAVARSERLVAYRESYHERLKAASAPARLFTVVDSLFSMPVINLAELTQATDVTKPTAAKDIEQLEQLKILTEYTGKKRDRDWLARDILAVIEAESTSNL